MIFNKKLYRVPLYVMIAYDNIFGRIIIKNVGIVIVSKKHKVAKDYLPEIEYGIVPEVLTNAWGEQYIEPPKWFKRGVINTYFFVDERNFDECHLASDEEVDNYLENPHPDWIENYKENLVPDPPKEKYVKFRYRRGL